MLRPVTKIAHWKGSMDSTIGQSFFLKCLGDKKGIPLFLEISIISIKTKNPGSYGNLLIEVNLYSFLKSINATLLQK